MYATLADLLQDIFNQHLPHFLVVILTYVNMFGLMMALAFAGAAYTLRKELHRKQLLGTLPIINRTTKDGKTIALTPSEMVSEIVVRAAIGGIIGAKIFHLFEYWSDFMADPAGMLFTGSGLTFYGGLLVGAAAVLHWVIKNKMPFHVMADAIAPGLMLAYGIGRMGCQIAGDGDWGFYNTAYITNDQDKVVVATDSMFQQKLFQQQDFFIRNYGDLKSFPQAHFKGPDFLPNFFFAYNYPNNVGSEGVVMHNCTGSHCAVLPIPVFPTPFYEIVMCLSLFTLIWLIRKKFAAAGMVMAFYLIVNGIERFTIEQIRVNSYYHFWGIQATQAEIIALVLIAAGVVYFFILNKRKKITE